MVKLRGTHQVIRVRAMLLDRKHPGTFQDKISRHASELCLQIENVT
jgi:hypothetical protein